MSKYSVGIAIANEVMKASRRSPVRTRRSLRIRSDDFFSPAIVDVGA